MAMYKAEFLAHYYERHRRPLAAYAFGYVSTWARLGALAPHLANLGAALPGVRQLAKRLVGMAPERQIPRLAGRTFRQWFLSRPPRPAGRGPRVVLWPDTFNDHFHPETLRAALEVLERIGCSVEIPAAPLCCGRPLYDFGMLAEARGRLQGAMRVLDEVLEAGTPIVGLEPSCVSVFRDELGKFYPDDPRAERLARQMVTFAEFLAQHADILPPLRLARRAIVHGHCHQQALMGLDADRALLDRTGVQYDVLDSGCCGMAGAFGFEREHYDVSMAVGERVLLPAVRGARGDTLVVADGFSCREQIAQVTDRRALHLAEVVHMAMFRGPSGPPGDRPERIYVPERRSMPPIAWLAGLTAGVAGAVALGRALRRSG
jgi:Fe-S oxidoreductase